MKKIIVSVVVIASLGNVASAGVLDVVNHSFEAQQGDWNNGAPTGWVQSSGFTSRGNFNPTTFYPGSFYADTPSGMDGVMSGFMLRNPDPGYFEQTLLGADGLAGGGDDPVLTADTTYTVTVAIGRRDGYRADSDGPEDFAGFIIELFAGTTVAGSATEVAGAYLPGSVAGDFTDYSFDFTTDATSAGLGEALKIRIGRETGGDPLYLDFDNVRIDGAFVLLPATLMISASADIVNVASTNLPVGIGVTNNLQFKGDLQWPAWSNLHTSSGTSETNWSFSSPTQGFYRVETTY